MYQAVCTKIDSTDFAVKLVLWLCLGARCRCCELQPLWVWNLSDRVRSAIAERKLGLKRYFRIFHRLTSFECWWACKCRNACSGSFFVGSCTCCLSLRGGVWCSANHADQIHYNSTAFCSVLKQFAPTSADTVTSLYQAWVDSALASCAEM